MRFLFQLTILFLFNIQNFEFTSVESSDVVVSERAAILSSNNVAVATAADQWLVQKLDHFDPSSSRTWWQKYHTNETWFKNSRSSPIFLLIGGNSRTEGKSVAEGALMEYAQKFNALTFQIEHRFYGESRPTDDLNVNNLRFLSVDQTLADIASFVEHMNARYRLNFNNKWIVFGKGYAGSLAAWARLKYPHLIYAAVSSSTPLQAVAGYSGYDNNVWKVLSTAKTSCPENIHEASLAMETLLKSPSGVGMLVRKFKRCSSLDVKNDTEVAFFVESLATHIRNTVESASGTLSSHSALSNLSVDEICNLMTDKKFGTPLDRYAAVNSLFTFGSLFTFNKCNDLSYDDYVAEYFTASRPWLYQRCSELGFFPVSESKNSLFGSLVDLQFYVNACKLAFGDAFGTKWLMNGVERLNMMYGGLDLETSNVLSIGGSLDLWRDLGLRKSSKRDLPVVIIDGAGLGAGLDVPSQDDHPQLVKARNIVQKFIGGWLSKNSTST